MDWQCELDRKSQPEPVLLVSSYNREGNRNLRGEGKERNRQILRCELNMLTLGKTLTCRMLSSYPCPSGIFLRWSHGYLNMEICKWGHSGSWKKWKYLDLAPSKRVWWWVIISMLSVGSQRHEWSSLQTTGLGTHKTPWQKISTLKLWVEPLLSNPDMTLRTVLTAKSLLMTHGLELNQQSLIFQDRQKSWHLPWSPCITWSVLKQCKNILLWGGGQGNHLISVIQLLIIHILLDQCIFETWLCS